MSRRSTTGIAALVVAIGCTAAPTARAYDPAGPYPSLAAATAAYDRDGLYVEYGIPGRSFVTGALLRGFSFDRRGVPKVRYRFGTFYSATVVAQYGLAGASRYLGARQSWNRGRPEDLARVRATSDWLVANQDRRGRWLFPFPLALRPIGTRVDAPWVSAMSQGLAISLLTRAYRMTGDPRYLGAAGRALAPFGRSTARGGVVTGFSGVPWYEEYPSRKPSHVLNGFLFSLVGLYDECPWSTRACHLFSVGMRSLRLRIARFDRRGGSFYYPGKVPASRAYHRIHVRFLQALLSVMPVRSLAAVTRRWARRA